MKPRAEALRSEHERFRKLFDALAARFESGEIRDCDAVWDDLQATLERHMRHEEREIFPRLEGTGEDGRSVVSELRRDHEKLRAALLDVGIAVQLREPRMQAVRDLAKAIDDHTAREDATVYPWMLTGEIPGTHPVSRAEAEATTAAGMIAGAVAGAMAGPVGAAAGALVGGVVGAMAGEALHRGEVKKEERDEKLDEEIGVFGGRLGEAPPDAPKAKIGAFHTASVGAGGGGEEGEEPDAAGPMSEPT